VKLLNKNSNQDLYSLNSLQSVNFFLNMLMTT